jgi:multidrug efflux pump subunit AcrA (membrane-fusion protein)
VCYYDIISIRFSIIYAETRPREKIMNTSFLDKPKSMANTGKTRILRFIDKHPLPTFFGLMALLVAIVVLGNHLRQPAPAAVAAEVPAKEVSLYHIGEAPRLQLQATIDKSGVINLVAQSSGVVQKIAVKEGDHVKRGSRIVNLSTNYQGGNAASLSRQISQTNYKFLDENLQNQKDIVNNQRDIARNVDTQNDKLREISRQSIDETSSLISLNEDIVNTLDQQISKLESMNVNGASDSAILAAKTGKSQVTAALNGLRSSLRNTQYTSSDDNEASKLSDLQRDVTLKQLDIQEKTLDLNKDIAKLNLRIGQVNEALMYPASPCPGVVERVYVKIGQVVNPGTLIATIRGDKNEATAVLLASQEVSAKISQIEESYIISGDTKVSVLPRYISKEPTTGTLHSILFSIPTEMADKFTNSSTVQVDVPIGYAQTTGSVPYIPLDAVYQTQEKSYVYVIDHDGNGKTIAKVREVQLGAVYGDYVEVKSGLAKGDEVIINRNVLEGDLVEVK